MHRIGLTPNQALIAAWLSLKINCVFSCRPQDAGTEVVTAKAGTGSATLSMAYAAARFADSCLRAMAGEAGIVECAYVASRLTDSPFFASPVRLGRAGIEEVPPLPEMNDVRGASRRTTHRKMKFLFFGLALGTCAQSAMCVLIHADSVDKHARLAHVQLHRLVPTGTPFCCRHPRKNELNFIEFYIVLPVNSRHRAAQPLAGREARPEGDEGRAGGQHCQGRAVRTAARQVSSGACRFLGVL